MNENKNLLMNKNTFQPWECIKLVAQLAFVAYGLVFLAFLWVALASLGWESYYEGLTK
jgi:hypothetical protein